MSSLLPCSNMVVCRTWYRRRSNTCTWVTNLNHVHVITYFATNALEANCALCSCRVCMPTRHIKSCRVWNIAKHRQELNWVYSLLSSPTQLERELARFRTNLRPCMQSYKISNGIWHHARVTTTCICCAYGSIASSMQLAKVLPRWMCSIHMAGERPHQETD